MSDDESSSASASAKAQAPKAHKTKMTPVQRFDYLQKQSNVPMSPLLRDNVLPDMVACLAQARKKNAAAADRVFEVVSARPLDPGRIRALGPVDVTGKAPLAYCRNVMNLASFKPTRASGGAGGGGGQRGNAAAAKARRDADVLRALREVVLVGHVGSELSGYIIYGYSSAPPDSDVETLSNVKYFVPIAPDLLEKFHLSTYRFDAMRGRLATLTADDQRPNTEVLGDDLPQEQAFFPPFDPRYYVRDLAYEVCKNRPSAAAAPPPALPKPKSAPAAAEKKTRAVVAGVAVPNRTVAPLQRYYNKRQAARAVLQAAVETPSGALLFEGDAEKWRALGLEPLSQTERLKTLTFPHDSVNGFDFGAIMRLLTEATQDCGRAAGTEPRNAMWNAGALARLTVLAHNLVGLTTQVFYERVQFKEGVNASDLMQLISAYANSQSGKQDLATCNAIRKTYHMFNNLFQQTFNAPFAQPKSAMTSILRAFSTCVERVPVIVEKTVPANLPFPLTCALTKRPLGVGERIVLFHGLLRSCNALRRRDGSEVRELVACVGVLCPKTVVPLFGSAALPQPLQDKKPVEDAAPPPPLPPVKRQRIDEETALVTAATVRPLPPPPIAKKAPLEFIIPPEHRAALRRSLNTSSALAPPPPQPATVNDGWYDLSVGVSPLANGCRADVIAYLLAESNAAMETSTIDALKPTIVAAMHRVAALSEDEPLLSVAAVIRRDNADLNAVLSSLAAIFGPVPPLPPPPVVVKTEDELLAEAYGFAIVNGNEAAPPPRRPALVFNASAVALMRAVTNAVAKSEELMAKQNKMLPPRLDRLKTAMKQHRDLILAALAVFFPAGLDAR